MANNNKTPFLGLTTPASGDYNWGAEINNNFINLDRVYGGLQSSMEGLETTQRQDGFFNFIEGQKYIILNSMLVGTDANNAATLFSNSSPNTNTYKGSEFFIAGTVQQNEDMTELEFAPVAFYCTTIKNDFPNFTNTAKAVMEEKEGYVKIPVLFSPTGQLNDARLERYNIKIEASSIDALLDKLSKLPRITTYQLANNTAFYVTTPARGYSNEETSTLYNKNAIYYERQLVIKYTDVGTVKFTSLNNITGGVYVPQKEVTSNAIRFIRRPITDASQSVNAYVDPWYVYGGTWDISGFSNDDEEPLGFWIKKYGQNYYYTYIPELGVNASDKGTKSYSIDFYRKAYEKTQNLLLIYQHKFTSGGFTMIAYDSISPAGDGEAGSIKCSGTTDDFIQTFFTGKLFPQGTYTLYMPTMKNSPRGGYSWKISNDETATVIATINGTHPDPVVFTLDHDTHLAFYIKVQNPSNEEYIEYPMLLKGNQTQNLPSFVPYAIYTGTLAKIIVEYEITNMNTSEQNLSELRVFGITDEQVKQLMGRVTYAKETITGATDTETLLNGLKAYVDKRISESVIQVINSNV